MKPVAGQARLPGLARWGAGIRPVAVADRAGADDDAELEELPATLGSPEWMVAHDVGDQIPKLRAQAWEPSRQCIR